MPEEPTTLTTEERGTRADAFVEAMRENAHGPQGRQGGPGEKKPAQKTGVAV